MRFLLFFLSIFSLITAQEKSILWKSDYRKAVEKAQAKKKPLLLLFTNPKECHWCADLHRLVLEDDEFIREMRKTCVFFMMDLSKEDLSQEEKKKNTELLDQFYIEWLPTIILLSSDEQVLGNLGYFSLSGKKYADSIKSILRGSGAISENFEGCPYDRKRG